MEAVAANEGAPPRTLGQTLAAERERQGLSRADVAQRLHMSAYQVEALENGDFGRLPQGTFLRGFVRNYAKVLGLAPGELLPMLGDGTAPAKRPGIVVPDESIRFDPNGQGLQNPYVKATGVAFVVIALGFAAMYWWLFVRPSPPANTAHRTGPTTVAETPVVKAPTPTPAPAATPPVTSMPTLQPPAAVPPPAAAQSKTATPPSAPVKTAEPPPPPSAEPTLKFVFKGQSWVEVRDSRGRLLFSRLNEAGSTEQVSGKPPFNVVVGNAPEVQLYYNDHEFDLEPHTKVAVARFTVE